MIPEAELLAWCNQRPEIRYVVIAGGVTPFRVSGEDGRARWTGTARKLLDGAPDRVAVLKEFADEFVPTAWVGTRISIIEANARLLDELVNYGDPALNEFVAKEKIRLSVPIQAEKLAQATQRELESRAGIEGPRFERFE